MVICAPCVAVAAPTIVPPLATLFGVGATAVVARKSLKGCKTKKKDKKIISFKEAAKRIQSRRR